MAGPYGGPGTPISVGPDPYSAAGIDVIDWDDGVAMLWDDLEDDPVAWDGTSTANRAPITGIGWELMIRRSFPWRT